MINIIYSNVLLSGQIKVGFDITDQATIEIIKRVDRDTRKEYLKAYLPIVKNYIIELEDYVILENMYINDIYCPYLFITRDLMQYKKLDRS